MADATLCFGVARHGFDEDVGADFDRPCFPEPLDEPFESLRLPFVPPLDDDRPRPFPRDLPPVRLPFPETSSAGTTTG